MDFARFEHKDFARQALLFLAATTELLQTEFDAAKAELRAQLGLK
jgi:hypothetical protein